MRLADVRRHALSLPGVAEEPHVQYSAFRVFGRLFAALPVSGRHVDVFVGEQPRRFALAMHPEFVRQLVRGGEVVGLRLLLDEAQPKAVERIVSQAWGRDARHTLAALRALRRLSLLSGRDAASLVAAPPLCCVP